MTCNGVCIRYKAKKPAGVGRYAVKQRRCQVCEIFIKWEGLWCPCCSYRLRTKPRNIKYKQKLRAVTLKSGDMVEVFIPDDDIKIADGEGKLIRRLEDKETRNDMECWLVSVGSKKLERFIEPYILGDENE